MNYAFAGDRDISVVILKRLIESLGYPSILCLSGSDRQSHAKNLLDLVDGKSVLFTGKEFSSRESMHLLKRFDLDYFFFIHFPYFVPQQILVMPKKGCINLHPAYLPFNRGWNTPSWAILDNTVVGATLHFMTDEIDRGDIISQKTVPVESFDTAHTLYKKLKACEVVVFEQALPAIKQGDLPRKKQSHFTGSEKKRGELNDPSIQCIDLDQPTTARALLNKIRALTTNKLEEAAYFKDQNKIVRVTINFEVADLDECTVVDQ